MAKSKDKSAKYAGKRNNSQRSKSVCDTNSNKTSDPRAYGDRGDKFNKSKSQNRDSVVYGGNDLSWYTRYSSMVDAAARVPFPYVPGRTLPVDRPILPESLDLGNNVVRDTYDWVYPGIYALSFYPCGSTSRDISSPLNIAAREIYARIRSKYSGSLEADAPDIMMYILAVDSMYMFIEDMKRAYYLINAYTPYNNYYPQIILKSLGYDPDNLAANKTLLYQRIQEAIAMASKFRVPNDMDIFKRHQFMCANVFADEPQTKSQNYVFKLGGYYKIDESDTLTKLSFINIDESDSSVFHTVDDMWTYFRDMYDALTEWDTSYTILGYLIRAFESSEFLIPAPVIEGAILDPVYNEDVLDQIQNSTCIHVTGSSLNITQDPINNNTLLCTPQWDISGGTNGVYSTLATEGILTLPGSDQPGPDKVIYATRLMALADPDGNVECGTEILTGWKLYNTLTGLPTYEYEGNAFILGDDVVTNTQLVRTYREFIEMMSLLESFDRHPSFIVLALDAVANTYYQSISVGSENVTTINYDLLANLHRMCVYSEFNCFGLLE